MELGNIAQQVMKYLKSECPSHIIFSACCHQFFYWKYNNIEDNQWSDRKQILDIFSKVISEVKFRVEYDKKKTSYQEYYFINHVNYRS